MLKKISAVAATAALLAVAPAFAEEAKPDMTLDQVLAAHFETIGGEDAWRALKSLKMEGTTFMAMMGIEAPTTMYFKSPSMFRRDFVVQGMTGTVAYDGTTAWQLMPFMGATEPEAMPAEMAEQMSEEGDVNPFLDWKDKGYELELVGIEEVDGTEAYKLKLTRPSGNVRYYYLDTDHFLPFKLDGKATFQGQEVEISATLGDYKEVDGLIFPHSIEQRQGGTDQPGMVVTINSIETNLEVDGSLFDMNAQTPAAAEPEG